MCGSLFKSPKVEKPKVETPPATAQVEAVKVPDPAPTQVAEVDNKQSSTNAKKKQQARRGYAATRGEDRSVLTDTAQAGGRQTLG